MLTIDINCDMGEGSGYDDAIMPFITSANIACGYHAGDEVTIRQTVELAAKYGVAIGGHPSFFDRKNFGRVDMTLPVDVIYDLVVLQLRTIEKIVQEFGQKIHHAKPHGALYNMSAQSPSVARAIAQAVKDFDKELILVGLSGSHSISEAELIDLRVANEVFADRTYQDDGSLTPRSHPNALIDQPERSVEQVLQMVQQRTLTSVHGRTVEVKPDTVCIHGDGNNAAQLAARIRDALKQNDIDVRAK